MRVCCYICLNELLFMCVSCLGKACCLHIQCICSAMPSRENVLYTQEAIGVMIQKQCLYNNRHTAVSQKTWIFINTFAKTSRVAMIDWSSKWMLRFSSVRWHWNVYTLFDKVSLQVRMFKYVRLMNQIYQSACQQRYFNTLITAVIRHTSCNDVVSPRTGFDAKMGRMAYCQLQSDLEFHSVT